MKNAGVLGVETLSSRECRQGENGESSERNFLQHFKMNKDSKNDFVNVVKVDCMCSSQSYGQAVLYIGALVQLRMNMRGLVPTGI